MSDTTEEVDFTNNDTTEETTVEESQETLESDSHDSYDDGLTPQAREFKEKRREENRKAREALKKLPTIEAELEKQKFFRKNPEAEDYEKELDEFRAKNPTIWLEQSFRYVLADKNPARLAELTDSGAYAQKTQGRTAPVTSDKSFSEQVWQNINLNDVDALKQMAEKEWAKKFG